MNTTRTSRKTKSVNSVRQATRSKNRKNGNGKKPQPYQKTDGNWYCTYQGKQYYLGSDPLRAQVKLETILAGSGDLRPRGGPTIKGVVESYLDSLVNNQSADTIQNKRSTYKQFVEFVEPDTLISNISPAVIEGYKQYALSRNKRPTVRTNLVRSLLFQQSVFVQNARSVFARSSAVEGISPTRIVPKAQMTSKFGAPSKAGGTNAGGARQRLSTDVSCPVTPRRGTCSIQL